ncbi:uncharacterized protein BDZ99DRAFT_8236 [Mytilinidion resinicola]|uniref:Uncharacterized protein n=1 Tax=Mytilinidion resinicola TaxID=574789 RepID=A0A6A6Z7I8_9PEZI|nr:uncharacterized protein BDZ99DRAFT_8236 [Mytilinidion resinicola]KAF2817061.1 hypothetical protein BDZ99DRAFT_8236 [Mytilinidion resinicola]
MHFVYFRFPNKDPDTSSSTIPYVSISPQAPQKPHLAQIPASPLSLFSHLAPVAAGRHKKRTRIRLRSPNLRGAGGAGESPVRHLRLPSVLPSLARQITITFPCKRPPNRPCFPYPPSRPPDRLRIAHAPCFGAVRTHLPVWNSVRVAGRLAICGRVMGRR